MPTIAVRRTVATGTTSPRILNPDDLKTARKLKGAINHFIARYPGQFRFGEPTSLEARPQNGKSGWTRPNSDKLISVQLEPKGRFALVDPKSNMFFLMEPGGLAGKPIAKGPYILPDALKFKTKDLTVSQLGRLEAAANDAKLTTKSENDKFVK